MYFLLSRSGKIVCDGLTHYRLGNHLLMLIKTVIAFEEISFFDHLLQLAAAWVAIFNLKMPV